MSTWRRRTVVCKNLQAIEVSKAAVTYVVEPVGATTNTDTLGTQAEREDFRNDDPCDRSPPVEVSNHAVAVVWAFDLRVTEVDGVQPDEDDSSPGRTLVVVPVVLVRASNTSDDEVGNRHPETSDDENRLTAETIDEENGRDGGEEHDDADHTGGKKRDGTASQTDTLEDEGGVVENRVHLGLMSVTNGVIER